MLSPRARILGERGKPATTQQYWDPEHEPANTAGRIQTMIREEPDHLCDVCLELNVSRQAIEFHQLVSSRKATH